MKLDKLDLNSYLNPNPLHLRAGQHLKYPFDDMCSEFGEDENEIVDDFSDYISEIEDTDKDETRNYFRQKLQEDKNNRKNYWLLRQKW